MAKKVQITKQENIDELDHRISVLTAKAVEHKKGNKNDKIVGDLITAKVNATWVVQKENLESQQ